MISYSFESFDELSILIFCFLLIEISLVRLFLISLVISEKSKIIKDFVFSYMIG